MKFKFQIQILLLIVGTAFMIGVLIPALISHDSYILPSIGGILFVLTILFILNFVPKLIKNIIKSSKKNEKIS